MNLGERIKNLRKSKGMTQEELGALLYVTDKTISSWESNRTEPSLEFVLKLSEVLESQVSFLLYGDEEKNNIETEIKIKLNLAESKSVENFMKDNADFILETKQVDTYYQPIFRKFLKDGDETVDEWLRIGVRGNKKILNYKHWYQNKYCDEYEVTIDDDANLDKILKILDLEVIAVVDKTRRKYMYKDKYEVSLDYVESLGYFIEIEVKKYDTSPLLEYDNLIKLVKDLDLNLANIDTRGYPYHIIYGN